MKSVLMDDGENMAVRMFLALYGGQAGVTVKLMRDHLRNCGFDGCWPKWVSDDDGHLTKGGAQDWLRYLFALEEAELPQREWADLTDAEIKRLYKQSRMPSGAVCRTQEQIFQRDCRAIEAKIKEKNK